MKKLLLWIWQLPQNLVGFILTRFSVTTHDIEMNDGSIQTIYFTNNVFGCGVSLGNYIILDYKNYYPSLYSFNNYKTYNHEHGHQIQSKYLGFLYLIVVGFVSAICNNVWDRLFHKKWKPQDRCKWYYSRYPEKWADKLGGVKR